MIKIQKLLTASLSLFMLLTINLYAQPESKTVIQNKYLKVSYNKTSSMFTFTALPSGKTFATTGNLYIRGGEVVKTKIKDKTYGTGESIEIKGDHGGKIILLPDLPFVLIKGKIKNDSSAYKVFNRIALASFHVNLGIPAEKLITSGTGGLISPDKNPGSYAWLAVADPQTNSGVVAGWITQERASGVLFGRAENGQVLIEARGDYGRLRLAAGKTEETETLAIGYFDDARLGLEGWADAVAKVNNIKLHNVPTGFCTWYCEKHGKAADEKSLAELTDFAEKNLKPWGFNFIQIDDNWQDGSSKGNGPNKNFTRVKPGGPYKSGMKATADYIKSKGLTPGIWFMPFAGSFNDPWFEQHQDWFAKKADGKPYDTAWGGTCFDMTYAPAREYLSNYIKQIAKVWGYTYFKMDGLSTGLAVTPKYVNDSYKEDGFGDAVFSNPDKTNVDAYRDGLKLIRKSAGSGVFFLGCCAAQNMRSYQGSFGLVDAMRIGPDNSGNWRGWLRASPSYGSRHYFLNGRIWWNDPDPNYVRASLSLDEARTMASFASISGTLNSNSDWMPDLAADRLEILKRTMLIHKATVRPVDYFENSVPTMWLVTDNRNNIERNVLAIFNYSDSVKQFDIPVSRLKLPASTEYAAFDFWANRFLPAITTTIKTTLPRHSCQVVAISPVADRPFVLSTSQHVTQGIMDIWDEKWDSKNKTLSGKSLVVANDAYELRLTVPKKYGKGAKATLTDKDLPAGTSVNLQPLSDGNRVLITSPKGGLVGWKIEFN